MKNNKNLYIVKELLAIFVTIYGIINLKAKYNIISNGNVR